MIKQLNGERENMVNQKKIDEAAKLWEKTKDPKYKDLWYKYIKEYVNGPNNIERRTVSTTSSIDKNDGKHIITKQSKLF